jgi:hypothetical protein
MPTPSIARPSKIIPSLDFWFENMPSGNPYVLNAIGHFRIACFYLAYIPSQTKALG